MLSMPWSNATSDHSGSRCDYMPLGPRGSAVAHPVWLQCRALWRTSKSLLQHVQHMIQMALCDDQRRQEAQYVRPGWQSDNTALHNASR